MSEAAKMIARAKRFSLMAQILETYDCDKERMAFVEAFRERGCMSEMSADLLLEEYCLENAQ